MGSRVKFKSSGVIPSIGDCVHGVNIKSEGFVRNMDLVNYDVNVLSETRLRYAVPSADSSA